MNTRHKQSKRRGMFVGGWLLWVAIVLRGIESPPPSRRPLFLEGGGGEGNKGKRLWETMTTALPQKPRFKSPRLSPPSSGSSLSVSSLFGHSHSYDHHPSREYPHETVFKNEAAMDVQTLTLHELRRQRALQREMDPSLSSTKQSSSPFVPICVHNVYTMFYPKHTKRANDPYLLYRFCITERDKLAPYFSTIPICIHDVDGWWTQHHLTDIGHPHSSHPDSEFPPPGLANVKIQMIYDMIHFRSKAMVVLDSALLNILLQDSESWDVEQQRAVLFATAQHGNELVATTVSNRFCQPPSPLASHLPLSQMDCLYAQYIRRQSVHGDWVVLPANTGEELQMLREINAIHQSLCTPTTSLEELYLLIFRGANLHHQCITEMHHDESESEDELLNVNHSTWTIGERLMNLAFQRTLSDSERVGSIAVLRDIGVDWNGLDIEKTNVLTHWLMRAVLHCSDKLWILSHYPSYMEQMLRSGVMVDLKDGYQNTALHLAAQLGLAHVAKSLLEWGADLNIRNAEFKSPLMLAANRETAAILLEYGANPSSTDPTTGANALMFAAEKGRVDVVDILTSSSNVGKAGSAGHFGSPQRSFINVNTPSSLGLHALMVTHSFPVAQLLLQRGANPNAVDMMGHTALDYAVHYGNLDLVGLLLDYGADVNHVDRDGFTVIDLAHLHHDAELLHVLEPYETKKELSNSIPQGEIDKMEHDDDEEVDEDAVLVRASTDSSIENGFEPDAYLLV